MKLLLLYNYSTLTWLLKRIVATGWYERGFYDYSDLKKPRANQLRTL